MYSTNKPHRFWRGFRYALHGVWRCLREERNFRFHITAAAYVLALAPHFALSRAEWALLFLTVGGVLCAELINSAVERTVDRIGTEQHPLAGAAKDMAAGAVLVLAIAAVGVGISLFGKPDSWLLLLAQWCVAPWRPCLLVASFVPAWLFVFKWR